MSNLVDVGRASWQAVHAAMSRVVTYTPYGGNPAPFQINAFVRGLRAEDLFGDALQTDVVGIISADDLALAMPGRARPLQYDRLAAIGQVYSVQEWRGAPHYLDPVFFKLLLRGGHQ